jgi:hypothetical protein
MLRNIKQATVNFMPLLKPFCSLFNRAFHFDAVIAAQVALRPNVSRREGDSDYEILAEMKKAAYVRHYERENRSSSVVDEIAAIVAAQVALRPEETRLQGNVDYGILVEMRQTALYLHKRERNHYPSHDPLARADEIAAIVATLVALQPEAAPDRGDLVILGEMKQSTLNRLRGRRIRNHWGRAQTFAAIIAAEVALRPEDKSGPRPPRSPIWRMLTA